MLDREHQIFQVNDICVAAPALMRLHPSSFGVVVSTADHFTHYAVQATSRAASLGATVELVDRGRLDRMLEGFHPAFPWMDFLDAHYPQLVEYYSKRGFGRI